jgi:hypothetical protein
VAITNAGDFAQPPEGTPPVARECFLRSDPDPEPVPFAFSGIRIQRIGGEGRQRDKYRYTRFFGVKENSVSCQPIDPATRGAADPQRGVSQEQNKRP